MPKIQFPIEIQTPPKRFDPVGHCIYCHEPATQEEHILAFGIAANSTVLPDASCETCSKITRDIETVCLQHLWWTFRTRIGAPTRRKTKRPKTFKLRKVRAEQTEKANEFSFTMLSEQAIPAQEFPLSLVMLQLPPPGLLIGRSPSVDFPIAVWARTDREEIKRHAPLDRDGIMIAPIEPVTFCRLLAKIAHGYAIATYRSKFRPLLNDLILGKVANPYPLVGGNMDVPPATAGLHDLFTSELTYGKSRYLVVSIRLFSFFGTPQYHVVAGEL